MPTESNISEGLRARRENFEKFKSECPFNPQLGCLSTTVQNIRGGVDRIDITAFPIEPVIESVDPDKETPVSFTPTSYDVTFRRYPQPTDTTSDDFTDDPESAEAIEGPRLNQIEDSPTKIKADIKAKFAALGMPNIPLSVYSLRLLTETGLPQVAAARARAHLILPLFRSLETKRLLSDPNSSKTSFLQLVTRRQHVYDQLMNLLRESKMSPAHISEYLLYGIFDSSHIAGVPIFTGEHGDKYIVINYSFSGYDEQHPEGTDFSGSYSPRSDYDIEQIVDLADQRGYSTHFESSGVSGGTHQHWKWYGIKIEGYDRENPENNTTKVVRILKDVGIDPNEAANNVEPQYESDLYIR